ncbi:MAG: hypothetical protein JXQ93_07925 [Flavobacteriaceae bacterium]
MKLPLHYSIFILFLFHFLVSQAQENEQPIDSSYTKYFQNTREIPHLHLNKTSFIQGEEIWFQAYVLEQNSKKLHPTTSNLYVSIFDDLGKLKDQQLIRIKEGKGSGSIYLDSTFNKKNYYLKASTKWMKNFNENNTFSQKVSIISSNSKKDTITTSASEKDFFEFQVFPESGYLVEEIENRVGILIKDKNNVGQKIIKGLLKEKSGKIVAEFLTNFMGLGSTRFYYDKNKKYTLEATLENGSTITKELPIAKQIGITLQVENPNTPYVKIRLLTNTPTLNLIENKEYTIWIHNTNTYYKNTITFKQNESAKILFIKSDKITKGINIVTVFDENDTPILERIFFNYNPDLFTKPRVSSVRVKGDSLTTTLTNNSDKKMHLSASFLPETTKAYSPSNNIYTNFLLNPYIKGDIQNPNYYFNNIDRKKLKNLDLLLLTQGWSKYSWSNVFNNLPRNNFDFENGMDVIIRLNTTLKPKQSVLIYSKDNNLIREIKPNENPYILQNTFIKKSTNLSFALKSNNDLLKITPILSYSNNSIIENIDLSSFYKPKNTELVISNFKRLSKDTELLDEVVVKGAKKEYANKVRGIFGMKRVDAKDLIVPSQYLPDYIKMERIKYSNVSRPLNTFFLNNNNISQDLWLTEGITMDQVREVAYGMNPYGTRELHIYTYSITEFYKEKANYTQVKLPVGFAIEKEFYNPKYPSFLNDTYKSYGAIFWKPNIVINPNSSIKIKTPNNSQKNINLYLEGITESGKLISKKYTLE